MLNLTLISILTRRLLLVIMGPPGALICRPDGRGTADFRRHLLKHSRMAGGWRHLVPTVEGMLNAAFFPC